MACWVDLCPLQRYLETFGRAICRSQVKVLQDSVCETVVHLTRHSYLLIICVSFGTLGLVRVVKHDGDAGFGDTSLPTFVYQVLLIRSAHLIQKEVQCYVKITLDTRHTVCMLVIPKTKQIASRMLDLPEPLRPVMALKDGSHPVIWVRTGYDLNPKIIASYHRQLDGRKD